MARAEQCKNQMKFKDLCEALTYEHYVNCLLTILEYLFEVMSSHYTMKKWHQDKLKESGNDKFFSDVLAEMDQFKKTMWDSMQRRVAAIFSTPNLSSFKIDDFLKVLDGVFQFVDIGEGFGSSVASNLRNAILQQSKSYFESFHRGRAEELRAMLSAELWVRLTLPPKFTLLDVKEFSSVVSGQLSKRKGSVAAAAVPSDSKFLALYAAGNPFSKMIQYQKKSSVAQVAQATDSDDEPDELKADRVDEGDALSPTLPPKKDAIVEGPVVTQTVINSVKILGKYLYMLKVLAPISLEVFVGITQVFQYFMHSIYLFFGAPPSIQQDNKGLQQQLIGGFSEAQKFIGIGEDSGMPPKLKQTVQKLKDKFGTDKFNPITLTASSLSSALQSLDGRPVAEELLKLKWILPKMPNNLELANPKTNYGLAYRVMGTESLAFLVAAVQEAKQYIQTLLPVNATEYFNSFYNDDVAAAEQFKLYCYKNNVAALLNTSQFTPAILSVSWDSTIVPTKASPYVDVIFKEYQLFAKKLEDASKVSNFPARVVRALWEGALIRGMEVIVDAFSRMKKCSNEGRVVMMQDVDAIREKLEKLSGIRPIPNIGYVETYVKAFYQLLLDPNADVVAWYKQHPEYTVNQVISLLNLGGSQNVFQSARRQTIIDALKALGK